MHVISIFPIYVLDLWGYETNSVYVNSPKVAPLYLAVSVGTVIVHWVDEQIQANNPVLDVSENTDVTRAPHEFSYSVYIVKSNTILEVPPEPVNVFGNV